MQSDRTTKISELRAAVARFVRKRNWEQFHTPKNLAMSIAIEAAELMEHFQWLNPEETSQLLASPDNKSRVADELADILIYSLAFANRAEIDISQAVWDKLDRNELRFPSASDAPSD